MKNKKGNTSLVKKAGNSAIWQMAGGIWTTVVRIGASVFLARLLSPEEFGTFGMSLLAYELVCALAAMGMGAGIVARKNLSDLDLNTCFWSMAVVRLVMFAICFISAPLASAFFNNSLLTDILRVISFTFLISALEVVPAALLTKELKFKTINLTQGITVLIESIFAVIIAKYTNLGYWSLVYAMVLNSLLSSIALFLLSGWRPKWQFSKESFDYLFKFGINSLGFSFMNYLSHNLDYLLVGRLLGAKGLGLYEFAYRIPHIIQLRVVQPIGSALFPTLSKVQDDDDKLLRGYVTTVQFLTLIAYPSLVGLALVADLLVPILWGEQWLPIITPLQILCFCAALRVTPQSVGAILLSKNRPDIPFKISIISLVWTTLCVSILGLHYGIVGVAWGMVISTLPQFISIHCAFRLINKPLNKLSQPLLPICYSTIAMALIVTLAKELMLALEFNDAIVLILAIIIGALGYIVFLLTIFNRFVRDLTNIVSEVLGVDLVNKFRWAFKY